MRKKIWLINQYAMPPKYEARIQTLKRAQYLIESGYDVTIISGSFLHNSNINLITDNRKFIKAQYDGIKFIHIKTNSYEGNGLKRFYNLILFAIRFFILSKKFDKPDVIAQIATVPFGNMIYFVAKRFEAKYNATYIGSASEIRGLEELVDSFAINDGLNLAIAGTFSDPEFETRLKGSEGWTKVDFLGLLSRESVKDLLSKSAVAIVTFLPAPNHIESQPNKMFEYMSAGLPLVASNFPLWMEIVEGNNCGICVDPSSPKEIAKAILYLNKNKEIARKMGENGRKTILEKYNWSAEVSKLLELYSLLLVEKK